MYLVKDTPIFANKKLYKVGDKFPYSNSEKHLLWNLTLVEDTPKEETPKVEELISKTETLKLKAKIKSKKSTK